MAAGAARRPLREVTMKATTPRFALVLGALRVSLGAEAQPATKVRRIGVLYFTSWS